MTPSDTGKWKAFYAAALGWLFDGYETYVLVLVASIAVREVVPPADLHDLPTYVGGLLGATLRLLVTPFAASETKGRPLPQ